MTQYRRARRIGLASILLALALRLYLMDAPVVLTRWAQDAYDRYRQEETGQDVRFSPSLAGFQPDFAESPPAAATEPTLPLIPSFSGEETVDIYYGTAKNPDISSLLARKLEWELYGEEPTVLILHTHSTESYTRQNEDYEETSRWRTTDENYNMLSIGAQVALRLNQAGIPAVQDRQLHDYPSYNGSYVDARKAISAYLEEFPTISLILDLHRDASGEEGVQLRTLAAVGDEACAQLMVVLGTNHEGYTENLSLGLKLHVLLESAHPGLTRPLQLRSQRFNQDLSPGALLIEVGAAGNTHEEALRAGDALADALIALARGTG